MKAKTTLEKIASIPIEKDEFRSHLGASIVGRKCARHIWYSFRWAIKDTFDNRMLRLFERGQLEESRFVGLLRKIGVEVWEVSDQTDLKGNPVQWRIVDHNGHFGGSLDGVGLGIPELPDIPVLLEFKTHNDKSFSKLVEDGVMMSKWEHFIQMQIYMNKMDLSHALYMAVNKNTDAIHAEIVERDPGIGTSFIERAGKIITTKQAPVKVNESPGYFVCKHCIHKGLCHGTLDADEVKVERNCRTCKHASPSMDPKKPGAWVCALGYSNINDKQKGCGVHEYHPDIIPPC